MLKVYTVQTREPTSPSSESTSFSMRILIAFIYFCQDTQGYSRKGLVICLMDVPPVLRKLCLN